MRFSISRHEENGFDLLSLHDHVSDCKVSIIPHYGAMLHALEVPVAGKPFNLIDSYPDNQTLLNNLHKSYKSSKLSPFVCRMRDGMYSFDGKEYEIERKFRDGNAIHGLLADKSFAVVNEFADDEQASVRLKYVYAADDAGYPFQYRCEVCYTLLAGGLLKVETLVINLEDHSIPMADGWHPYFQLGGRTDDLYLQFNSESMVEFDNLLPTGRILPYTEYHEEKLIGTEFFDNCFVLRKTEGPAACTLYNPENELGISFFPDDNYRYLQLYTPLERTSFAIENLTGAADCFNNEFGLITLQPRESRNFVVHYQVEAPALQET
jgi:aldose 1-epimerase